MKAASKLRDGARTSVRMRGFTIHMDEPRDAGGDDSAPTPTEMLAGSLGSCMAITAKMYAERKGWPLEGVDVAIEIVRFLASDYPSAAGQTGYVHEIREDVTLHGPLDDQQRSRLLQIAQRCPVSRALGTPSYFVANLHTGDDVVN